MMSLRLYVSVRAVAVLIVASLALPSTASAHCDSMDGPVVHAARRALETGNVAHALVWVRAEDEVEIRAAFERTRAVRALSPEARDLADLWFFEMLVRVHREGEGEPYTGLKPAGAEVPPGIAAADRAVEEGSVDALADAVGAHVAAAIRARFEHVRARSAYDPSDVAAGREYVHAYVEFIHFVEALDALARGHKGHGNLQ